MALAAIQTTLTRLSWARLGAAALVLVVGEWLRQETAAPIQFPLFLLAVGGLGVSSLLLLLGPGPAAEGRHFAWLQVVLDTSLVTAIVATTGGPRSFFTFLYVLTVMEGCILLSRPGAVMVAAVASVLYIGIVLAKTILPLLGLMEPTETTGVEVLTVFTNVGVLMVIAIVAGALAERYAGAQQALETQHRHLSDLQAFRDLIFESVGTGLIAVSPTGRITAFNSAAEAIAGVPAAEALGRSWESIFGLDIDLDAVREAVARHGGGSERHEIRLERRDGRRIPVGVTFWQLRAGDGTVLGLIGVCQDLSSIKQMEERMRQADRLATVGRLSANIAHEIRNPLASVSGAIEALSRELPPDPIQSRLIEIVLRESERLNRLITDFLDYARPAPLTLVDVDVARLVEEVLLLLEHRRPPDALASALANAIPDALPDALPDTLKVVTVLNEVAGPLPIRADPQLLRQVLWNLCLNAVQAMPDGGELRVGGRRHGAGWIRVWVADTGSGIAQEDLPHVFEPFYSTKPQGTGLGLASVYRIVQDHGGQIEIQSRPGEGTVMTLTLPAAPALARSHA